MYEKIKNIFTQNILWKIFSILAAISAWIMVMNMNNPIEIKTFSFDINFINQDILTQNNITILNIEELKNKQIDVKISASRPTLLEITNLLNSAEANFTVDLADLANYTIDPDTSFIPITISPSIPALHYPNNSFEVISYSPATIGVVADNIIAVPRKIEAEVINEVPNGYISFSPIISTSNIQVIGAKSVINKISKIVAPIDVKDQTSSILADVTPIAYDLDNNIIEGIEFNLDSVQVEVPISKKSSVSIKTPSITGSPASGYLIKDVSMSHNFIEVTGSSSNIYKLGTIELPSIDISGIKETTTFTRDISSILTQNKLTSSANISRVSITVEIEQVSTRTIELEQIDINIIGNLETTNVKVLSERIYFIIQGQKEFINMVTLASLNPYINITGFEDGEALIPLNITLPSGITLLEKPLVKVDLTILDDIIQDENIESDLGDIDDLDENIENNSENNIENNLDEEDNSGDLNDLDNTGNLDESLENNLGEEVLGDLDELNNLNNSNNILPNLEDFNNFESETSGDNYSIEDTSLENTSLENNILSDELIENSSEVTTVVTTGADISNNITDINMEFTIETVSNSLTNVLSEHLIIEANFLNQEIGTEVIT